MLSSIHPFGERARGQRYGVTATAFVSGSLIGGGVLGGALAAGSALAAQVASPMPVLAMAFLVVAAGWDLLRLPVPSLKRQVDENWLPRYRGWVYGLGFGIQLGVGFATYVKSLLSYGLAIAAIAAGSPRLALLAGLGFGLTRGLSILVTARVHSPGQLRSTFERLGRIQPVVRLAGATGITLLAVLGLM